MKRTNLILLCFMAYVPVFSQVDTIADNIYEHNGSLGIGINEPQNAISIEGNEDEWPGRIFLSISNRSVSNKSFAYLRISSGESGNGTHLGHISETFTANGSP